MFDKACLLCLKGRRTVLAPFLTRLTPCLTALAPDQTVLDIEDVDNVDWSEECDDFAEDFVDISSMRRIKEEIWPTFKCPSQISMEFLFHQPRWDQASP
jgi:hypothetical protein